MRGPRPAQGGSQTEGALARSEPGPKRGTLEGMAAALEEYRLFKAAGMLKQWRERWRRFFLHRNR